MTEPAVAETELMQALLYEFCCDTDSLLEWRALV
jgi:hypothetical protein